MTVSSLRPKCKDHLRIDVTSIVSSHRLILAAIERVELLVPWASVV